MILGLSSFVFMEQSAGRAVCSTGAMAGLFGAAAGLNLRDRIRRRKSAHLFFAAGLLIVIGAALVAVSVMSLQRDIEGAWSPFVGAAFLLVLAVICGRLAKSIRSSGQTQENRRRTQTSEKSALQPRPKGAHTKQAAGEKRADGDSDTLLQESGEAKQDASPSSPVSPASPASQEVER